MNNIKTSLSIIGTMRSSIISTTIALACLALATGASAGNGAAHSMPGKANSHGQSYGEWSAAQWQWTYSMPADQHPLFDTADCSAGQSGSVWFLGGTYSAAPIAPNVIVGVADRTCTIPHGKSLFFPIVNVESAVAEGNGTTEAELRAAAADVADHATGLSCTVDGVQVSKIQRAASPLFTWGPLPENNVFQDPGNFPAGLTSQSVADGYYVMLPPLSTGTHTIHWTGSIVYTQADDGFDFSFSQDITYHITVR